MKRLVMLCCLLFYMKYRFRIINNNPLFAPSIQLRSPMQIVMAMDADQRNELEGMIADLEEENRYARHSNYN